jgi:hypothetical protein
MYNCDNGYSVGGTESGATSFAGAKCTKSGEYETIDASECKRTVVTLTGVAKNAMTGEALDGVNVEVQAGGKSISVKSSYATGYTAKNVPREQGTVLASKTGYIDAKDSWQPSSGNTVDVNLRPVLNSDDWSVVFNVETVSERSRRTSRF